MKKQDLRPYKNSVIGYFYRNIKSSNSGWMKKYIADGKIWLSNGFFVIGIPKDEMIFNPDRFESFDMEKVFSGINSKGYEDAEIDCFYKERGKLIAKLISKTHTTYFDDSMISMFSDHCTFKIKGEIDPAGIYYLGELVGVICPIRTRRI